MKNEIKTINQVEEFWNDNLCGKNFVESDYLSEEFFKKYTAFRYRKTHHLNKYIDWPEARGKDVLEIGLGIGADGCRWAENAKSYTGVDLTLEAVEATKRHLFLRGLKGEVYQGNAEEMPFQDRRFDIVYSHGVLHHTMNINRAFIEVSRVLKDGGEFIVMLYSRGSLNYWVRIQGVFRLIFLINLLKWKLGFNLKGIWKNHIENYERKGWAYFGWKEWPHHCTDGADCEVANIYYKKEVKRMLVESGFSVKKMKKAHLPFGLPPKFERLLASFMGFHLIAWAEKTKC